MIFATGTGSAIEFGLLGPVEARAGGARVGLGSAKVQCVLAVLLRAPGALVSRDALIDRVWGDRLPGASVRYKYIGWLRAALEPHGVNLVCRDGGYLIAARAEQVDLYRFRRSVALAQAARSEGVLESACRLVADGLAQWRGSAVAGLTGAWAELFRDQLERERRDARVLFARCLLDLGRAREALRLLSEWQVDDPVNEELIGLHVLALHQCGRRADALSAYRYAVRRLNQSFGVGPGRWLADLECRILAGDAGPDPTARPRP